MDKNFVPVVFGFYIMGHVSILRDTPVYHIQSYTHTSACNILEIDSQQSSRELDTQKVVS